MNEFNSLCFWKRFYRNSVYNCITNFKIEKFFSKSILYFSNCEFQNAKELQFENIIKFLIVLPNRTMERCYKFAIKKIKITCYPSSFNFHSIFPGYTYPRLIVDRNLVAVQRSITRDFFFFQPRANYRWRMWTVQLRVRKHFIRHWGKSNTTMVD